MAPIGSPRERRFAFVVTEEERAMLEALAKSEHRSSGDWLRVTIRRLHEERFGAKPKKSKR